MEVLFEQYLDKLNYNRYTTSFFIEKDSVFIFFGDYKVSTITDDLDKLNLKFSKIKYYFAPFLHTSVKGITINTKSLYPDILKKVEEKKVPIKVLKTLPQKLNSSIIVDLFPLLNKLSLLFEKRKLDKFDIYFKIVKDYNEKFSKYSAPIYNILYINPKKTSEEFLFDLHTYLKRKNFELDVNINNLYFAILDEKNVIYGKLGEYDSKEEVLKINYFSFKRLLYIYKKTKEKFDKKETDFTKTLDIEKLVNVIVKKYNINKKDVKENLKIILKEYISKNPKELQSASLDIEEIFSRALNEIAGVDINLKNLSEKDKKNLLEKIGSAFVRSTEIAPKLSEDYEKIYSPDKLLKVSSTVIDRHKREFDEILDTYIYKIFKTFEQGEYPLKLLSMDKKIKDNNVNRVIEYSFTFEDIHKNKHEVKVNIPAVINDRYFKLNGKYYILTNQLFLRPITKSKHNSVRFLSNYATLTIELKNTKIPISDINALLNYVVNKYSKHILLAVENELNEQIDPNFPPIKYSQIVFDTNDVFYGFNPIGNGEFILFQKLDENGDVVYEDIYDSNEKKIY
ncbi:TPA: hypothetical protein EYP45_03810, partial [Candidatus Peregrinibacteria bacterium]|nr:hypothetical protein [Candidatus Peregrinibacteria bacterium]